MIVTIDGTQVVVCDECGSGTIAGPDGLAPLAAKLTGDGWDLFDTDGTDANCPSCKDEEETEDETEDSEV
jgi:hypothetical protein